MLNFVDFSHFQHDSNLILPDVPIFLKHQKTKGFPVFSRGKKWEQ